MDLKTRCGQRGLWPKRLYSIINTVIPHLTNINTCWRVTKRTAWSHTCSQKREMAFPWGNKDKMLDGDDEMSHKIVPFTLKCSCVSYDACIFKFYHWRSLTLIILAFVFFSPAYSFLSGTTSAPHCHCVTYAQSNLNIILLPYDKKGEQMQQVVPVWTAGGFLVHLVKPNAAFLIKDPPGDDRVLSRSESVSG